MNNWYNRIAGQNPVSQASPFNNMQQFFNAMSNPAAFVKQQFPDIPEDIQNNPDAILNYLQRTRGPQLTQQIQQLSGIHGRR